MVTLRPSQLKQKVAQLIRDEFDRMGIRANLFAGDFRTADGFWRRVDVYRWQIYLELYHPEQVIEGEVVPGRFKRDELCCWESLTDCAKRGISISLNPSGSFSKVWEADLLTDQERAERKAEKKIAA